MLLGREKERKQLRTVLSEARRGESAVLVVRGEPGIGKSALLRDTVAKARGMLVLAATGVESESELPFSALSDLLAPAINRLDRIPSRQAEALAGAFALAPLASGDPFSIYAGSLSLLASAAEETPILVVVDDAQWLDTSSRAAVLFAARRIHAEGIALLLATRDEDDVFASAELPEMTVRGLERDAADILVAQTTGKKVASRVLERLHVATAGNPLALAEIPSLVTEQQLTGLEPLDEPLPISPTIERAFRKQLDTLPPEGQAALVLAAASISGQLDEVRSACRNLNIEPAALEAAEAAGLVDFGAESLRFRHPLLRSAVYHAASQAQRRAAHAALAATTEDARRAWHLAAAVVGPDETVAANLEDTAWIARRQGGIGEAARAFERAAQLSTAQDRRVGRLVQAGGDYFLAGQFDHALELLEHAQRMSADPRTRADIQHLRGRGQMLSGGVPPMEAHALLTTEASRIEHVDPDKAALMLAEATLASYMAWRPKLARETAQRAHDLATRGHGASVLPTTLRLAEALVFSGDVDQARPLLANCRTELQQIDVLAAAQFLPTYAYVLMILEEYSDAREIIERLVAGARAASAAGALPYPLAILSEIDFRTGRWAHAAAHAFEAVRLAEETGQANMLSYALCCRARIEAALGDEPGFDRDITTTLERAGREGAEGLMFYAGSGHALLLLPLGQSGEAIRHLSPLSRLVEETGGAESGVVPWQADFVEALAQAGRRPEAEAELAKLERAARRTQLRWMLAASARCRGILASDKDYDREFTEALRWLGETPTPFEHARTELALGVRRRRAGRRLQARAPLRAALELFDHLGARRWADLTRAELRAAGEVIRQREQEPAERLTPQELQVALVVARGVTNREAAEALFLSPKTIEYHLGHVYRKMDVRSRTELARLFAGEDAETRTPERASGVGPAVRASGSSRA